jgi:O-methyltransferase
MHHATKKQLASLLWPRFSQAVEAINRNAELMATIRNVEAKGDIKQCSNREELYSVVNDKLGNAGITYLEFGVWKGQSLEAWASVNTNPASRLFGFDSFEGLPDNWAHAFGTTKKGDFGLKGLPPTISDPRVALVKGWFQHTLRDFLKGTKLSHPIVVHNDSDLHSSTHYTLSTLDPLLEAGDVIIFDEYSSAVNEYLAWEQYKRAFMREAKCIAMSDRWTQAAFIIL